MAALICTDCGQQYKASAGHCWGGRYGGCCRSFESSVDFDHHRVGSFSGGQRCRTDEELLDAGWRLIEHRWLSPQGWRNRRESRKS